MQPTLLSSAVRILSGERSGSNSFASGCLPLCFGGLAAFVEELPIEHNIVLEQFRVIGTRWTLKWGEVIPRSNSISVDSPIVGDDEGNHHRHHNYLVSCVSGCPFAVFPIILSGGLVHVF